PRAWRPRPSRRPPPALDEHAKAPARARRELRDVDRPLVELGLGIAAGDGDRDLVGLANDLGSAGERLLIRAAARGPGIHSARRRRVPHQGGADAWLTRK